MAASLLCELGILQVWNVTPFIQVVLVYVVVDHVTLYANHGVDAAPSIDASEYYPCGECNSTLRSTTARPFLKETVYFLWDWEPAFFILCLQALQDTRGRKVRISLRLRWIYLSS
ncbi:hypothetical protein MTO96_022467 [Rhipicephalus appendiculatus]